MFYEVSKVSQQLFGRLATLILLLLASPVGKAAAQAAASRVELTAIRAMLARYSPSHIVVDPVYALADQAPPGRTARARPSAHQQVLTDSLTGSDPAATADTLTIRASQPLLLGDSATISVTVSRSAGRRYYETVAFVLERKESRWRVRRGVQLGIS